MNSARRIPGLSLLAIMVLAWLGGCSTIDINVEDPAADGLDCLL